MSGFGSFFLCFYILGFILCSSSAWQVKMPSHIKGLLGSCLVIPCTFDYYQYPPARPDHVVWYQYVSRGYPLVCDNQYPRSVIDLFKGRTYVYSSSHSRMCTLKIDPVRWSDHRQKLYPWVDPDNVGSSTYSFYDTTVIIEVVETPDKPDIEIFGHKKVGQSVTVQCSVYHTCSINPPTLTLNIPLRDQDLTHSHQSDGRSKTTLKATLFLNEELQTVKCTVRHPGGRSASVTKHFTAECSISGLTVSPTSYEFHEGIAKEVTCTASYTCSRQEPHLRWRYGSKVLPASIHTEKVSGEARWRTISTLTFTPPGNDLGRLTCCAHFTGSQTQEESITLRIKRNMLSRGWSFTTPGSITGLRGSCLIIPCRFYYSTSKPTDLQVIWYLYQSSRYPAVFNQRDGNVINEFNGRTSLIGSVAENNCSLKIERLEMSHNHDRLYPWIDKNPITSYHTEGHTFYDRSTELIISDGAPEPQLRVSDIPKVGKQCSVSCIVHHMCISAPPTINLNGIPGTDQVMDTVVSDGIWGRTVKRTWKVEEEHQSVSCAVSYPSGQKATKEIPLNVECSISPLSINSISDEFLEGYESQITCTALYTCAKHTPTFTWNYGSVAASSNTNRLPGKALWRTVSTLTFKPSASDHGRSVTCYAIFTGGQTQEMSLTLRVKRNMGSRSWSFTTPDSVTGLKGSCLIIPCRFTYRETQPIDLQVIWYLYHSNGYPVVFNQRDRNVINEFIGRTSLIGSVAENNCSLKIERLEMSHNHDRLYPWIDKNPITSYHTEGYSFYDRSTELIVSEHAPEPQISVTGTPRVGEQGSVSCSVHHACMSAPPVLHLNGIPGTDRIMDTVVSDGIWERTIERSWAVKEEYQSVSVSCTVNYPGGQTATKEIPVNVECPYEEIIMVEPPGEITEGMAKSFICSVIYKCKRNKPTILWNYKDMQNSLQTKQISEIEYKLVANLTFIPSLSDGGKSLTCTAQFVTGETSASATLIVKKYERVIDPFENHTYSALPADVPFRFSALTRSCVVIPCSFQYIENEPMTRGIWSKKKGGIVFHNGQSNILDHFKGRTKMLGNLNEGNCTLEIDDIKPFDNGPFCFSAEKGHETYKFNNSCVFIVMKASPEKPVMTQVPEEVDAGSTITVSCAVTHTCSSHPPVFSWSVSNLTSEVSHTMMSQGIWQTTSTITFIVTEGDGVRSLTCTAIFWRNKQQAHTVNLNVKGSLMYQFKSAAPVAFPVSVLVLIIVILAAVFAVFIWRKKKHTNDSLNPPPRPEKRRSLWDRLSRRYPEDRDRPPRPEKRRSILSRLSRRAEEDRIGWQSNHNFRQSIWSRFSRRRDNTANISVGYLNNTATIICDTVSKTRFPSPKDNCRRPPPASPEDCQLYGNI